MTPFCLTLKTCEYFIDISSCCKVNLVYAREYPKFAGFRYAALSTNISFLKIKKVFHARHLFSITSCKEFFVIHFCKSQYQTLKLNEKLLVAEPYNPKS